MRKIISKFKKRTAPFEEITINLDLDPAKRWAFAKAYTEDINERIECY